MECKTIIEYNNKGKPVWKDKVKHATLEKAEEVAELFNNRKNIFIKRQAYKCKKCKQFHVGTTTEMLLNKELPERKKWIGNQMRVVGQIDVSLLCKKPIIKSTAKTVIKKNNSLVESIREKPGSKLLSVKLYLTKNKTSFYDIHLLTNSVKIIFPCGIIRYVKYSTIYGKKAKIESFTPGIKEIKKYIFEKKL